MRAQEFITEAAGQIHKDHAHVSPGIVRARDVGGYDRIYHMNRLMMAMAMSDGMSQDAVEMDYDSFAEKYNTVHPYTQEEYNMFVAASKTVPTEKQTIVPYSKSKEPEDTNTKSAVVSFKGYKRK